MADTACCVVCGSDGRWTIPAGRVAAASYGPIPAGVLVKVGAGWYCMRCLSPAVREALAGRGASGKVGR